MKFTKMHGIGNDYIYIETFTQKIGDDLKVELVRNLSDRHFGIGGDGVIFVNPSDEADCEMEMYNADGSRSEMCGNGIRCVGKLLYDHGFTDKTDISVISAGTIKKLKMVPKTEEYNRFSGLKYGKRKDGTVIDSVTVNMGKPILKPAEIPVMPLKYDDKISCDIDFDSKDLCLMMPLDIDGSNYKITCVSMGNPHAVIYVDDPDAFPLMAEGPKIENHKIFPRKTNVEFIKIIDRNNIRMRVWERGTGETYACGTGACAAAVSSVLNGFTDTDVIVHLKGGDLSITWDRSVDAVFMTGTAVTVFEGVF
ncbi:MAG: diaminopimelate epimerase [Lachnospiraceae bacterium]|nr:diaminopimelate epimerase [Lachnospiraceae bacterium]